jgi:hypothetical protein
MYNLRFEPTIPVYGRLKTVWALFRAGTVICPSMISHKMKEDEIDGTGSKHSGDEVWLQTFSR